MSKVFNRDVEVKGILTAAGIVSPNVAMGVGNVYLVYNTADTNVAAHLVKKYGGMTYDDGTKILYPATSTTANEGIQAALDACVANRNDYVIVWPSDTNYGLAAALTMSKKAVHLICPAGLSSPSPMGNTARLKQLGSGNAVIAVTAQAVEIAGFYLKNYTALSTITLGAAAHSPNIHHNSFMLVWSGSQAAAIAGTTTGGAWGIIEHNWFISESGTAQTAAIGCIDIAAQATGCRVKYNEITIGDANTATVAISNLAVKGHTDYNVFSTGGGTGGTGVITNCIVIPTLEAAIGNRGAVASGCLLSGGSSGSSFCDNLDGRATSGTDIWNLEA